MADESSWLDKAEAWFGDLIVGLEGLTGGQIELPAVTALLHDPRPETIILLALLFDLLTKSAALSGMVSGPVSWLEALAGQVENKLNRANRGGKTLAVRGIVVMLFLAFGAFLGGVFLQGLLSPLPQGWVVTVLILAALLDFRLPFGQVLRLTRAMRGGDKVAARQRARPFYGATAPDADNHAMGRAAVEYLGSSISMGLVGVVFWYLLAGLPGVFVFRVIMALNHSWNDDAPQRRAFAAGPAFFADVMTLPAMIIVLPLVVLASLATPGGKPLAALAIGLRDGGKFRNRTTGIAVAAIAGALGLALAGPRNFGPLVTGSQRLKTSWIGVRGGRARLTVEDVRRALFLYLVAALIALLCLALWLNLAVQTGL